MTRKDYLALSAALKQSKALLLPDATSPRQAAELQHRACVEAIAVTLMEASGFDEGRFLADSLVRPAIMLVNFNSDPPLIQDRSRHALPFDLPDDFTPNPERLGEYKRADGAIEGPLLHEPADD